MKHLPSITVVSALLLASAHSKTININLYNNGGGADISQLDIDELAGFTPVSGDHWNNIGFNNGNLSSAAAQKNITLKDDAANATAATFISTLNSAFVGFSGASQGAGTEGNRDMMSSYLSFKPSDGGNLQVTGLDSSFTTPGYKVYVYFDTDSTNRVHTLTLTPNGSSALVKIGDDSSSYSGTFVSSTGSGNYANMAIFENITASSFTLAMNANSGRAAVNGIQIVSNDHTLPPAAPEITLFKADDHYVTSGTSIQLNWQASDATTLIIDHGIGMSLAVLQTEVVPHRSSLIRQLRSSYRSLIQQEPQQALCGLLSVPKDRTLYFLWSMIWAGKTPQFHSTPAPLYLINAIEPLICKLSPLMAGSLPRPMPVRFVHPHAFH